jgi:hypothetical protein
MIMGCSLGQAIKIMGHDKITDDEELWSKLGTESGFVSGSPPTDSVALQKHKDPNSEREHWTVSWRGTVLDPARIKELWPVSKHCVIDWL